MKTDKEIKLELLASKQKHHFGIEETDHNEIFVSVKDALDLMDEYRDVSSPSPDNTARTAEEILASQTNAQGIHIQHYLSPDGFVWKMILKAMEEFKSQQEIVRRCPICNGNELHEQCTICEGKGFLIQQDNKEVDEKCPICGNPNNDCDKIF